MIHDRAYVLAVKAAEESRGRIREDCRKASAQLVPILEKISEHLLDPKLSGKALLRWCRVRDKNISARFSQDLGLPLWAYVTKRRMQVGASLLRGTKLQAYSIGMVLGYTSAQSFSRAFRRWAGVSPHEYRKDGDATTDGESADEDLGGPPVPLSDAGALVDPDEMRRALSGELDDHEAAALLRAVDTFSDCLRTTYPSLRAGAGQPEKPILGAQFVEESMARTVWDKLSGLTFDEQRSLIRTQVAFQTPALYRLLCNKALHVGREDPPRGIEIAELALASVAGVAEHAEPDVVTHMNAQAWAVLGNVRGQAEDYSGALSAFEVASGLLAGLGQEASPWIMLELFIFQGSLAMRLGLIRQASEFFTMVNFILDNPDPARFREERRLEGRVE